MVGQGVGWWDAAVRSRRMSTSYRLAVIPGDGIGTEVVAEGLKVLDVAAARHGIAFDRIEYDLGARRYDATGEVLPDSVLDELGRPTRSCSAPSATRRVPPGVLERGLLLRLRFALDHHVNLRPVKLYPGVATPLAGKGPEHIDMVVVPRGHRGPVRRCRRRSARGHAARGRHRGEHQHRLRRRAHRPRRVRPRHAGAATR